MKTLALVLLLLPGVAGAQIVCSKTSWGPECDKWFPKTGCTYNPTTTLYDCPPGVLFSNRVDPPKTAWPAPASPTLDEARAICERHRTTTTQGSAIIVRTENAFAEVCYQVDERAKLSDTDAADLATLKAFVGSVK
jgi:hypothetical protein